MTKGNYELYKPQGANDSSWKSFTCTLLIFLIICLIILLVSWPWKPHQKQNDDGMHTDKLYKENDTNKVHSAPPSDEKIVKIVHTTTTQSASDDDGRTEENHGYYQPAREHVETTAKTEENLDTVIVGVHTINDEKNSKIIQSTTIPPHNTDSDNDTTKDGVIYKHPYHWSDKNPTEKTQTEKNFDTVIVKVDAINEERNSKIIQSTTIPPHNTENYGDKNTENGVTYKHPYHWANNNSTEKTGGSDSKFETVTDKSIKYYLYNSTTSRNDNYTNTSRSEKFADKEHTSEKAVSPDGVLLESWTLAECRTLLNDKKFCNNTGCKVISSKMLSLMNDEVDPCKDFYSHTCDGIKQQYLAENDLSLDVSKRITSTLKKKNGNEDYIKQYKTFLKSCETYDFTMANDSVKNIFDSVGRFYESTSLDTIPSITFLLTEMLKNNFPALFDVTVNVDKINSKLGLVVMPILNKRLLKYMFGENYYDKTCFESINVHKGPYNLNETYQHYKKCQADKTAYLSTVKESLQLLDAFNGSNPDNIAEVMESVKTMIQIVKETRLSHDDTKAKVSPPSRLTNHVLCQRMPQVDWSYVFKNLIGIELSQDTYVQVYHAEYLDDLLRSLVEKLNTRQMNNALLAMYAHQIYRDYILDQKINCDRKPYCLSLSNKLMEDVSSILYLDSFTKQSINEFDIRSSEIFTDLKKTLITEIKTGNLLADTMDVKNALEKLNILNLINIGKYMPWQDRKFLSNRFFEINLNENKFIENSQQLQCRYRQHMYSSYGNDPKLPESIWTILSLPYDTEIKTILDLDLIVLPLATTSRNTFPKNIPKYLLMSDFGMKLAQQLIVYLQLNGIKVLDRTYNQNPTMSITVDQIVDDEKETFHLDMNSDHFLKERLPNIAGAKLAYLTYKQNSDNSSTDLPLLWTDKSNDKLFFINMAQQYCSKSNLYEDRISLFEETKLPGIMKVNSIAMNSEQFPEVFNCSSSAVNNMPAGIKLPQTLPTDSDYPINPNDSK